MFAVSVLAALPVLLWFGRDHWFYLDEFQILGADGRSNTGYLDGHSGHWITVAALLRRGVRVAAFYGVPLGATYLSWYVLFGRDSAFPVRLDGGAVSYFRRMLWAVFDALAQNGVFGALLLVVAALGVSAAVLRAHRSGDRAVAALPVGLATAWLTFAVLPSLTRAEATSAFGFGGRLLHVSAAFVLPLVAAGAEELARRRTALGVAALVPLAVGMPGNLDRLSETSILFKSNRQVAYAVATPGTSMTSPPT